jgi:hypothetical protein
MKTTPCIARVVVILAALTGTAFAADADWKAGFASIKITPETPVMMSGYAARIKPFQEVAQDIYAKALVLEDSGGQRAVVVTTDLVGMSRSEVEPLAQKITEKTRLSREQILLTWSHSHAGPDLSLNPNPSGGVAPADAANRVVYTRWLIDRLVELVARANATLEPVRLSHGRGVAGFVMNRREFTAKGIILGVAPQGPVDRSVPCSGSTASMGNRASCSSAPPATTRRSAAGITRFAATTPATPSTIPGKKSRSAGHVHDGLRRRRQSLPARHAGAGEGARRGAGA